jgi:glutamate/tyrosine decarboxylase-like PLP-dependent enzyme
MKGTIDDIEGLGKIAFCHDIGLHVDCCLGGFILPFAKKLGYSIPGEEAARLNCSNNAVKDSLDTPR